MRPDFRPLTATVLVALLLLLSGVSATGHLTQRDALQRTITVACARPLAEVVGILQDRLGVVITYEDPPYLHSSQIRDATAEFRPGAPLTARRTLVPLGGPFSFSYAMPGGTLDEQATPILESLLQQYRAQGYAGSFQIEKTGRIFHVVPTELRSRAGLDETFLPILSTALQIQGTRISQSALVALRELVDALGRTAHARVVLATIPNNLLYQTTVTVDAGTGTAREELVRILAATRQRLSWRLLFDPNEPEGYYLNIAIVR